MENVLEFNRKKVEESKEQRSISEQISALNEEISHWEGQRVLLVDYGPDVFSKDEPDEKKRNQSYMGTMGSINQKITSLRLEMKRLSKELKLP